MVRRIALVTTRDMPVVDADEELLLPLLPEATLVAWEDGTIDWSQFDVAIVRSTWNYTSHHHEFLSWTRRVSALTRLVNPADTIAWNTDKRYLADLAARGVPVVPTTYVDVGQAVPEHTVVPLDAHVVVKPTIGAGSHGARLFNADASGAAAHVAALHASGRAAMIQPYLDGVDVAGETALIFVGGEFSHAARKAAILSRAMTWSTGLYADEKVGPTTPTREQLRVADDALAALPGLGYARVDVLPTADGPVILELELTEPSLFLALDELAATRAANAFRALAR